MLHVSTARADEIIVVDGNSTDGTKTIAAKFPGIRFLQTDRPCRAVQMNAGGEASSGEVLLFLHCDVRLGPDALNAVRHAMRNPKVLGGSFDIRYEGDDLAAACFSSINRQRRRYGIVYGDSGIFCRRSIFQAFGGYRPWPILEDYEFGRRLWKAGKLAFLPEPIQVSNRRWRKRGLMATLCSWLLIQGLYTLGMSPHRLARLYQVVR